MTGRSSFSTLRNRMSPEAQERARAKSEALESEMALAEVRRAMKLSQEELAAILHINPASVAKMEKRTDMYIGTLRRFIQAMGGRAGDRGALPRPPDQDRPVQPGRCGSGGPLIQVISEVVMGG